MELKEKYEHLKQTILSYKSAAVAFSSGVDSTFLLKVAYDVLKDNTMAITASSDIFAQREYKEAIAYTAQLGVKHEILTVDALSVENFAKNPSNRCYYCKKAVFTNILHLAKEHNMEYVMDGANVDDEGDYRPGMQAAHELGIKSPLKECGFTKADIRALSKEMGLPTWDKPSYACLASRIPYGNEITIEKLKMVEAAEKYLMELGFKQLRVRHHGKLARIEVLPDDRKRFYNEEFMDQVADKMKEIGFFYTALDLRGYRTGSLNEVLK